MIVIVVVNVSEFIEVHDEWYCVLWKCMYVAYLEYIIIYEYELCYIYLTRYVKFDWTEIMYTESWLEEASIHLSSITSLGFGLLLQGVWILLVVL